MEDRDSEEVLKKIMEDGTFDDLRKQIVQQLKQNVCATTVVFVLRIAEHQCLCIYCNPKIGTPPSEVFNNPGQDDLLKFTEVAVMSSNTLRQCSKDLLHKDKWKELFDAIRKELECVSSTHACTGTQHLSMNAVNPGLRHTLHAKLLYHLW